MATPDPKWISIARAFIGTLEIPGVRNSPAVLKFFADAGHPEVHDDETSWCAAFVGACLHNAGLKGTGTLWALDYAKWGVRLTAPLVGAIATKKRLPIGGHTFFVVGYDENTVWGLGGNQNNRVSVAPFPRAAIYSYAWPLGAQLPKDWPKTFRVANVSKAIVSES